MLVESHEGVVFVTDSKWSHISSDSYTDVTSQSLPRPGALSTPCPRRLTSANTWWLRVPAPSRGQLPREPHGHPAPPPSPVPFCPPPGWSSGHLSPSPHRTGSPWREVTDQITCPTCSWLTWQRAHLLPSQSLPVPGWLQTARIFFSTIKYPAQILPVNAGGISHPDESMGGN